ncbi:calcium-binding protein [Jannaschia formosa]|uniref:calcium-binding protein n=1 Tax=Jannaschia formosa TaxID=2259592 RepID=UPI000E1BAB1A|nr:calcium-binding protein [Jannaschia formosa]TFL19260.1 calcium-binding protein [Jannaschia formosa]
MSIKLPQTAEDDISDGFDSTARLAVGEIFTGRFELVDASGAPANDRDKIGVELVGGTDYTITLNGPAGPRLVLSVTQPNTFLPGSAFAVAGSTELEFTPSASGLFFIDVAGRASGTDVYTVVVEAAPPSVIIGDEQGLPIFGTDGDDLIEARGGNDTVDGLAGNDTLLGETGDDLLVGNAGDDSLDGGLGADLVQGGAGNDSYVVDDLRDRVEEVAADAGVDTVTSSVRFALPEGVENLTGSGGANIRLDGNGGDNVLTGNAGNNILVGFGGSDTMTGGAGNDTFVIARPGGSDVRVTDFSEGDRIAVDDQLLGIGARGIDIRELTAEVFRDLRDSGAVGYNGRTGELRIDIDGDGDRELVATLEGGARLGLDDVLLF